MTPITNNKGVIHIKDAITLLETGCPCNLRVWKLSTGDIIEYRNVRCTGGFWRRGTHRIKLPESKLLREFRDVTLFEINNMTIYR